MDLYRIKARNRREMEKLNMPAWRSISMLSSVPLPTPDGPETMMGWRLAGRFCCAVVVAAAEGGVVEEAIASSESEGTSRVRARSICQLGGATPTGGQPTPSQQRCPGEGTERKKLEAPRAEYLNRGG
jgi:hypothetical protein